MEIPDIHLSIGIDPVSERVILLGISDKAGVPERLERRNKYEDMAYWRAFSMNSPEFPISIVRWLNSCGVPFDEAKESTQKLIECLCKR